jgi:hypothetical protein
MAFSSSLLRAVFPLSRHSPGNTWMYGPGTTNSSTEIAAVGFFTGCGIGSRAGNPVGMRVGDPVCVIANTGTTISSTGKVTWHVVLASSANQASTSASSGFNALAFDVTISAGTTV